MFGLFYIAAIALGAIVSGIKCAIEEQKQIDKAIKKREEGNNKYNLYTDRKGATRDLATGQLRKMDYISCEKEGQDQYLRDIYGNPIRNLSEERRAERAREARNDPRRTVYLWKEGCTNTMAGEKGNPYYCGKLYKDLKNDKIYVCRMIRFPKCISEDWGCGKFYMDVSNGFLVREADSQIFDRQHGNYKYSEELNKKFIEYFNQEQRKGGFNKSARNISVSGWEQKENNLSKIVRMGDYYCNSGNCLDEPQRRYL